VVQAWYKKMAKSRGGDIQFQLTVIMRKYLELLDIIF
jgi:hypothetical protein